MEQAISLEQTNALRISLGLRPILTEKAAESDDVKAWKQREKDAEKTAAAISTQAKIEEMENRIRHHKATRVEPKASNLNWLAKVKAVNSIAKSESEPESSPSVPPEPVPETIPTAKPIPKTKSAPKQPETESRLISNDRFEGTFDPLEKEDRPVIQTESDFKKVKFKTKKKKSLNKRVVDEEDYKLPSTFSIDDEEEDLHQILGQNRMNKLKIQAPEEIAKLVKEESTTDTPSKEGIVISSTTDFLLSMRKRLEEPPAPSVEPVVETFEEPAVIEEAEQENELVSNGLAATLSLLKSKGVVKPENDRKRRKNKEWLQKVATQRLQRDFELRQQQESIDHLPSKKRSEYLEAQDKQNAKEELELAKRQFEDYQPVVELEHRDDQGNLLDPKQAFKHLSHKFHGNSEGRKRAMKRKSHADATKKEIAKPLFD